MDLAITGRVAESTYEHLPYTGFGRVSNSIQYLKSELTLELKSLVESNRIATTPTPTPVPVRLHLTLIY